MPGASKDPFAPPVDILSACWKLRLFERLGFRLIGLQGQDMAGLRSL